MAASYPSSVKSFPTRTNGQTIADTWFNGPQDEIAAIEGGLLNGFAHTVKPSSAGGQDLGSTSVPWANGYFTGLPMDIGLCEGRLTLTSGTAVTTTDVTAATSIYWTPYNGNRIALYDGSNWALYAFTELTLALGTLTSGLPYDVFVYNNSGTLTLEALAWTSGTARATALALQNGVYVKTGATTRRYLGTFYTTSTTTTEDSTTKRYLWNYYNRKRRMLQRVETTASWTYTTATIRQANGASANQVELVTGVAETPLWLMAVVTEAGNGTAVNVRFGIGVNSTTTIASTGGWAQTTGVTNTPLPPAVYEAVPAIGRNFYAWNEASDAAGTTTWFGTSASGSSAVQAAGASGLFGWIEG